MRVTHEPDGYHLTMTQLREPSSRTLTVVLSETEWRALREVEPDAVGWLQGCIRDRLGTSAQPEPKPAASAYPVRAATSWGDDEY
jgi:hypothetical protein